WLSGVSFKHLTFDVIKRSLILSMIIGSALTLLNQTSAIFGQGEFQLIPTVFMFITPFIVITLSQLVAAEQARIDCINGQNINPDISFLNILVNRNIGMRALIIALIMGLTNCTLMGLISLGIDGSLSLLSENLVFQFFILPLLFGALSQAITIKRHLKLAMKSSA
ncbi:MAG: hypothetical protein V7785_15040, partial [Bermanella sp.]